MTDGEKLKALRAEMCLSQAKFGTMLGIPKNTIARWEVGAMDMKPWLFPMIECYARQEYARWRAGERPLKGEDNDEADSP